MEALQEELAAVQSLRLTAERQHVICTAQKTKHEKTKQDRVKPVPPRAQSVELRREEPKHVRAGITPKVQMHLSKKPNGLGSFWDSKQPRKV